MTQPVLALSDPPLVQLLHDHFSEDSLAQLMDGGPVPAPEVWRASMHEPLQSFLSRPGKEFRARLVQASYFIAGGKEQLPEAIPMLVEVLHAGSLIVDDIEDESATRRGAPALHREYGLPVALNAGNWLYFWAYALIEQLGVGPHIELSMYRWTSRALLRCHHGQGLDLTARVTKLAQSEVAAVVSATTTLKTGCLMELAAAIGAVTAGAPSPKVMALAKFGRELGVGLQMLDDLSGLYNEQRCHKGHEDLLNARPTWAWAWLSQDLSAAAYAELLELAADVEQQRAHPETLAQQMRHQIRRCKHNYKARAREHLRSTLQELRAAIGPHPLIGELTQEIRRLERSYV